jgi:hypothetical protein
VTWPRSGMTAAGRCWELPTLVPRTDATDSGSWPTPTSTLGTKGGRVTPSKAREGGTLIEALSARTTWPTPHGMSKDGRSNGPSGNELGRAVNQSLRTWPTPVHSEARQGMQIRREGKKGTQTSLTTEVGGSLNPTWVEWLMGWPLGWTDLKPWEMDKCHSAPQKRGAC